MRILCAKSGVDFTVQHFPLYLTARESSHPIFDVPTEKLLDTADKYLSGELTHTDNYLLYLALFNSTGLVDFRVPAIQTEHTQSIIAANMLSLYRIVNVIHSIGTLEQVRTKFLLPEFVISPDTKTLSNSRFWIEIWNKNYEDWKSGYKSSTQVEKINRRESQLERLIKDKTKDISSYAALLAEWACDVSEFPTFPVIIDGFNNTSLPSPEMPIASYWKHIIKACAKKEPVYHIPDSDIQELIEHCEDCVDLHGHIFGHTLMALLRDAASKKFTYLDLGDINVTSTYKILDSDASVEDANMLSLILSAPKTAPTASEYPNKLAFIQAKMKYQQAMAYYSEHPEQHPEYVEVESTDRRIGDESTGAAPTEGDL